MLAQDQQESKRNQWESSVPRFPAELPPSVTDEIVRKSRNSVKLLDRLNTPECAALKEKHIWNSRKWLAQSGQWGVIGKAPKGLHEAEARMCAEAIPYALFELSDHVFSNPNGEMCESDILKVVCPVLMVLTYDRYPAICERTGCDFSHWLPAYLMSCDYFLVFLDKLTGHTLDWNKMVSAIGIPQGSIE